MQVRQVHLYLESRRKACKRHPKQQYLFQSVYTNCECKKITNKVRANVVSFAVCMNIDVCVCVFIYEFIFILRNTTNFLMATSLP